MKTGLVNYRIAPAMNDGSVIVRRARTAHHCSGGHDGKKPTFCDLPIAKGIVYVEYVGEAHPFQSGSRYHIGCAAQQGLLEQIGPLTYKITRCYDDSEVVVAVGVQSLREAEEMQARYMKEAALDPKFTSQPDFYIDTEGR
jgi:hypothetical protein